VVEDKKTAKITFSLLQNSNFIITHCQKNPTVFQINGMMPKWFVDNDSSPDCICIRPMHGQGSLWHSVGWVWSSQTGRAWLKSEWAATGRIIQRCAQVWSA